VPAFMLYITRFQIQPEERMMEKLFGGEFLNYAARVRRWL
jgi:protein-S-isoprenylcysteine O-methyltransferase Ste14